MSARSLRYALITLLLVTTGALYAKPNPIKFGGEKHFKTIKQITFGGENAEAYFSFASDKLVMQATRDGLKCDQIFTMNLDGSDMKLVSTGTGRTTCSYFLPGDDRILFSSTHKAGPACPPVPDHSKGYVWPLYDSMNIYTAKADGSDLKLLSGTSSYDAEATVSPDGKSIVFTSTRDGDLELYRMDVDGTNVKRLTFEKGYDGGAFYSPDSQYIVYRAMYPKGKAAIADYDRLLKEGLVRPSALDIYVMKADGTQKRRVTSNGAANFGPFYHPSGEKIIFSSNLGDPSGRNFDLYMINVDGTGLEQITFYEGFDGFPMFSPDGKKFVFASNRNNSKPGETNVFMVEWQE